MSIQDEILIATKYGMDTVFTYPEGFELDEKLIQGPRATQENPGAVFRLAIAPRKP